MNGRKKGFSILCLRALFTFTFLVLCLVAACNPEYKDENPGDSFRKIYDKSDNSHYLGLDVAQTPDGGYIILGEVDRAPYLLRVDEQGRFLWDTAFTLSEDYQDPAPGILIRESANPGGTEYYLFCIKGTEQFNPTILLKFYEKEKRLINTEPEEIELLDKDGFKLFREPIRAAKIADDRFLLLAQYKDNLDISLLKIDTLGVVLDSEEHPYPGSCVIDYQPGDNRCQIAASLSDHSRSFFQTFRREVKEGSLADTLQICFMTAMGKADDPLDTNIAELELAKPFIAMEWHGAAGDSSTLSGVRVEGGLIHYMVNVPIRDADTYEGGEALLELDETLPVYIQTAVSGGEEIVFFLGTARSGDIEIYAYKLANGNFWGHMEINGGRERYVAAGLIETHDGGLAVLGNTNIESRMGR
ncbi:MAG: hypothetical protein L0Y73_04670, partial [Candidatus Aminicenantes bacterium]|nr:hypothetical protein [Candidatus Aminicenantes bacterium]